MKVKEFLKNVDWKSAGVGALGTLLAIGVYKGVKCGVNSAKNAYKAAVAARNAALNEITSTETEEGKDVKEEKK